MVTSILLSFHEIHVDPDLLFCPCCELAQINLPVLYSCQCDNVSDNVARCDCGQLWNIGSFTCSHCGLISDLSF